MILLDALYINYGGALSLLHYLVEVMENKGIDMFLLADARCKGQFDNLSHIEYKNASILSRNTFYKEHKNKFSAVLCFGNVPPPLKMDVPVYTYFHNVNMLTLDNCRDGKQKLVFWLKRLFVKFYKKHSDGWFVQTSNTANELIIHLGISEDKVRLFPFYKPLVFPIGLGDRTDYIFVGEYSGSKGHKELLEAWRLLHDKGIDKTLHLTVSLGVDFLEKLQHAIDEGVQIVNHGYISVEQLSKLYMKSKATIYPSFNESFGLGLVEAMEAGCSVIGADLPYTYAICKPSVSFNPHEPASIADAIERFERGDSPRTELLISNKIEDMINVLQYT